MQILKRFYIVGFLGLALMFTGCGGDGSGEQNGSISLILSSNDSGTGIYDVDATAVFSSIRLVSGVPTSLSGVPVTFSYTISTSSNQAGTSASVGSDTDATGTARYSFRIVQKDEPILLKVTAGTGDVKSDAQYITIPALISPN